LSYDDYAALIVAAVHNGFADQLMIASDMARHARLMRNGGTSYSTVFSELVPRLHAHGLGPEMIDRLLSHNPLNFLALHG
jgi:predicted metal-dependent phosphotriesterase family hydrolase